MIILPEWNSSESTGSSAKSCRTLRWTRYLDPMQSKYSVDTSRTKTNPKSLSIPNEKWCLRVESSSDLHFLSKKNSLKTTLLLFMLKKYLNLVCQSNQKTKQNKAKNTIMERNKYNILFKPKKIKCGYYSLIF